MTIQINQDTLDLYILGALSEAEERQVEQYLLDRPEVLAQVRAEREALTQMVLDLPSTEVPAGAEARLLARLHAETGQQAVRPPPGSASPSRPRPRTARTWVVAFTAAAAVVAGVIALPHLQDWTATRAYQSARAQPGAKASPLLGAGGERIGELTRTADGHVLVLMDGAPSRDRSYQAWSIQGQSVTSLGVFNGRVFASSSAFPQGATFGLTLEPRGGRSVPTLPPLSTLSL